MADFIEGKRPVIEALRTGVPIKSILMADNVQRDGLIEDILRKAKRAGATVEMVPRKVLDGKGRISREAAEKKVGAIYNEFRKKQDLEYISEFDRQTEKYLKGE